MNLEICKTCPHCDAYPKPGESHGDQSRRHYHCLKALPKQGEGFTAANPTNFIAEEYDERRLEGKKLVTERVIAPKTMFKVPATCPRKNEH